tara:strand:- start:8765 stop:10060 length:1296 start_codon:yes stop_codon:yes gene_type:complete
MSNRYLEIQPTNSNASFSYNEGRPIITFQISEQEALLLPRSVRFVGQFNAYKNQARDTDDTDRLAMDSRLGVWSIIDQLVISSVRSKQSIEHLRHANRFYSTFFPSTSDEKHLIGAFGETGLTLPSTDGQRTSVIEESSATASNNANEFCIHLPSGLLSGTSAIPLSATSGVGGLEISIHLSPSSAVLFDKNGDASAAGLLNAFYEVFNCKLICEVHDPSPQDMPKTTGGQLEYNSFSGYYQTINSTNADINFSLGLSRVKGVFMNFIPSSYLNNLNQNSMATLIPTRATGQIADLSQVVFTKGGMRYPLDYNVDTAYKQDNTQQQVDPQVYRNGLNAVIPFNAVSHSLISPINSNKDWTTNGNSVLEGGVNYNIGVAYDTVGSEGANFMNQAWGVQMDIGLTDNNPVSAFIFVNAKQTILFSAGQIQVLQ